MPKDPPISSSVYDKLKPIVEVIAPALTTFWLTFASIWNIPYAEPIGATMVALTTLGGAFLLVSNKRWRDIQEDLESEKLHAGDILVDVEDPGLMTMALESDPEELKGAKELSFTVVRKPLSQ